MLDLIRRVALRLRLLFISGTGRRRAGVRLVVAPTPADRTETPPTPSRRIDPHTGSTRSSTAPPPSPYAPTSPSMSNGCGGGSWPWRRWGWICPVRAGSMGWRSPDGHGIGGRGAVVAVARDEGKACYLVTDGEGGPVSRLAEATEAVQLGMGRELLAHAREMVADAPRGELRFLAERLGEALGDALRVAESRGQRLRRRRD